ncbi:MAG: hypothetical protein ACKO1H_13570, partial [Tabrizicola sp.]
MTGRLGFLYVNRVYIGQFMEALRYLLLSLCLGGLTVWGSENLFWSMPSADLTALEWGLTVVAYSIASAVALSAVIWVGVGGWPAVFLGAAIVGYMSEGVIVGTIYQPFPPLFFLVWTPLAWHALITGGVLMGLGRAGAALGPWRLAFVWTAYGLFGAFWAQYWVSERSDLGATPGLAVYLVGCGLVVVLAHVVMDRMGSLPRPSRWVLWIAPGIAAAVWVLQSVADPNPMRVVLPLILGLILWVMWRLGDRSKPVSLGVPVPVWRHFLFLIAPSLVAALAPLAWAQGWGTLEANWIVAVLSILGSVIWMG